MPFPPWWEFRCCVPPSLPWLMLSKNPSVLAGGWHPRRDAFFEAPLHGRMLPAVPAQDRDRPACQGSSEGHMSPLIICIVESVLAVVLLKEDSLCCPQVPVQCQQLMASTQTHTRKHTHTRTHAHRHRQRHTHTCAPTYSDAHTHLFVPNARSQCNKCR